MREYFETSRRTCVRVWPDETVPVEGLFPSFRALRPVIMSGWEMPLLLRALEQARPAPAILQNWDAVRDELVSEGRLHGEELVSVLKRRSMRFGASGSASISTTGSRATSRTVGWRSYAVWWPSPIAQCS